MLTQSAFEYKPSHEAKLPDKITVEVHACSTPMTPKIDRIEPAKTGIKTGILRPKTGIYSRFSFIFNPQTGIAHLPMGVRACPRGPIPPKTGIYSRSIPAFIPVFKWQYGGYGAIQGVLAL